MQAGWSRTAAALVATVGVLVQITGQKACDMEGLVRLNLLS
jgi:hypothetical protein